MVYILNAYKNMKIRLDTLLPDNTAPQCILLLRIFKYYLFYNIIYFIFQTWTWPNLTN